MCVTVVADSPDRLKVKGILVCLLWGRRQDDTDGAGNLCCQVAGLEIRLIAKLRHGSAYTFLGFFTDRWIIFAGSGNLPPHGYAGSKRKYASDPAFFISV